MQESYNIEQLISLEEYDNDVNKLNDNLKLISHITPKIALIEMALKNIIDIYFKKNKRAKLDNKF